MTLRRKNAIISIFYLISSINLAQVDPVPKKGGVSFRVDDNGLISQYRDYIDLFDRYNSKFNFAVNLANVEFNSDEYVDSIRKFQNLGHLLMDHTPSHATYFF
jgi:hypothetical protein